MPSDDVTHKIVLSPLDGSHTDDAVTIKAGCGHTAWIGPSSLAAVMNPLLRTETVCNRCFDPKEVRALLGPHGGLRAVPGTREELRRAIGDKEADEFWERFNVQERLD